MRYPLSVAVYTVLTLFIYSFVWYYRVNRELQQFGRQRGDDELANSKPGNSVLAFTLGGLLLGIPPIVTVSKTLGRIRRCEGILAPPDKPVGWIAVLFAAGYVCALITRGSRTRRHGSWSRA
jgi:hypothetical protein